MTIVLPAFAQARRNRYLVRRTASATTDSSPHSTMSLNYKSAGVDLDTYAESMGRIPALIGRTQTPRVLPLAGGFAGLFQLHGDGNRYEDPVLVSGTDGVG